MTTNSAELPHPQGSQSKALRGTILLLITSIIWGFAFVAQRTSMNTIGPFALNGLRFVLGSVALLPLIAYRQRKGLAQTADTSKKTLIIGGIIAGCFLFGGASFQQVALQYTTAGKAGFITGMYVVLVPILGLFWGQRTGWLTWTGIILAVLGLYLLAVTDTFTIEYGDLLVLIGAFIWAAHVQIIGYFSVRADPIKFSAIQFAVTGVLSLVTMLFFETLTMEMIRGALIAILYLGVLSSGVAYTLQVVGQQYTSPASASVILSLEAPFAALGGWLVLGEVLNNRGLIGCALMLAGMLVAQLKGSAEPQ